MDDRGQKKYNGDIHNTAARTWKGERWQHLRSKYPTLDVPIICVSEVSGASVQIVSVPGNCPHEREGPTITFHDRFQTRIVGNRTRIDWPRFRNRDLVLVTALCLMVAFFWWRIGGGIIDIIAIVRSSANKPDWPT